MYLGREGKCEVDETEKGWFVMYIDRDPETLAKMEARAKRERSELDAEEKHQRDLERQAKAARLTGAGADGAQATELVRAAEGEKIQIGGISSALSASTGKAKLLPGCSLFGESSSVTGADGGASGSNGGAGGGKRPMSAIEALMREGKAREEREAAAAHAAAQAAAQAAAEAAAAGGGGRLPSVRKDYWVKAGLVVKVLNKRLRDGAYHKQKGTIERVVDKCAAKLQPPKHPTSSPNQAEGERVVDKSA
jgi:DNA/RNA-binding protein KIN17